MALLSGWSNMEMGFNNLRMMLLRDVSTLKVVRHRTQLLSQSKHFWSLLSNKSCCCTPNNRDEIVAITSCRKKELFKTLIHINLKCRHSILCLVYFSFHLKFLYSKLFPKITPHRDDNPPQRGKIGRNTQPVIIDHQ